MVVIVVGIQSLPTSTTERFAVPSTCTSYVRHEINRHKVKRLHNPGKETVVVLNKTKPQPTRSSVIVILSTHSLLRKVYSITQPST